MTATQASAPASPTTTTISVAESPTFVQFLDNVPPPLTVTLVELSPYIAKLRAVAEIASWKRSNSQSWLLVAGWWAVCLLSGVFLRFLLPFAFLFLIVSRTSFPPVPRPPLTEQTLQATVVDLSVFQACIPSITPLEFPVVPIPVLLRTFAFIYIPYVILTHTAGLHVALGVLGTVLLTWRAPWARTLRRVISRSGWVRWATHLAWSRITGQQANKAKLQQVVVQKPTTESQSEPIRFLFTVFENQRWWVGLDWTAALLPNERPSWCSQTHQPLSPPSTFALPSPKSVIVDDGGGKLVKRTAHWVWEEPEWKVVVRKELNSTKRVELAPPVGKEVGALSESRIDKTFKKFMELGGPRKGLEQAPGGMEASTSQESALSDGESDVTTEGDTEVEEPLTDVDGWVYGDNHWKGLGNSGGMGKYTRFRRWTRIALLIEEIVPASADDVKKQEEQAKLKETPPSPTSTAVIEPESPTTRLLASPDSEGGGTGQRLKKRLQAAVYGNAGST